MPVILARSSQQAAGYRPEGGVERCGYCRFFSGPSHCNRILGPVSARGWCRFFSREIWLRMDGGDAIFGVGTSGPAGQTVDLNFTTMSTLDPSVTFARASVATYYNNAGVMQTAASGAPRLDYDPVAHTQSGLLIEEARTNLVINSFGLGGWGISGTTRTANAGTAPDGTNNLTLISETATTAAHYTSTSMTTVASTAYTNSVFAKASGTQYLQVVTDDGTNGAFATFDLLAGAISGPITAKGTGVAGTAAIQNVGNGIYRCSVSATLGAATTGRIALCLSNVGNPGFAPSYAGNTAHGVLLWGGQMEQGQFVTSYIPTTGAAVTRAADVATIATLTGRNAAAESYAAEFNLLAVNASANPRIVGGSATQLGPLFVNTALDGATTDLVGTAATANVLTLGSVAKVAANWASPNAGRVCLNAGAVVGATTLTTGFGAMTSPKLMGDSAAADTATGYMRRFRYWPRVLADTELQSVTT